MRTVAVICALCIGVCAWTDDKATVTISGKGKTIEVRDAAGNVEVIDPSKLRLNQIPADAAAREKIYREKIEAQSSELAARRAEEAAAADIAAKEADDAKAAEEAKQVAAATEAELEHEEHYPRKLRRNTVRGTRYVENPPPPPREEAPASTEPVLSISGKKQAAAAPEPADAPEATPPAPAPAPEPAPAPGSEPESV